MQIRIAFNQQNLLSHTWYPLGTEIIFKNKSESLNKKLISTDATRVVFHCVYLSGVVLLYTFTNRMHALLGGRGSRKCPLFFIHLYRLCCIRQTMNKSLSLYHTARQLQRNSCLSIQRLECVKTRKTQKNRTNQKYIWSIFLKLILKFKQCTISVCICVIEEHPTSETFSSFYINIKHQKQKEVT
jgi:hypothetical protein